MPVDIGSRIDDDAEDERNEEVLCDCFFPQRKTSLGVSPLMRRTEREVRSDSCDEVDRVFTEGDAIHKLCAIVSFKTTRRRAVHNSSRVMRDSCGRSVSSFQGCVSSQTRVSRKSSETSSFALEA